MLIKGVAELNMNGEWPTSHNKRSGDDPYCMKIATEA